MLSEKKKLSVPPAELPVVESPIKSLAEELKEVQKSVQMVELHQLKREAQVSKSTLTNKSQQLMPYPLMYLLSVVGSLNLLPSLLSVTFPPDITWSEIIFSVMDVTRVANLPI